MNGQAVRKGHLAILIALLLGPLAVSNASADDNVFEAGGMKISLNGWKVSGGGPDGTMVLFRSPITVTPQGYRRMWERWEYPTAQTDVRPAYRTDLQFIENDCKGRRMRSLQRNTFVGADMTGVPGWASEKGSDWQFVPPGSLADGLMKIACSGHTALNKTTIVLPNAPPLSPEIVHTAVAAYARVQSQSGAMGAVAFITDCFAKLPPSPIWSKVDFCVAFDADSGLIAPTVPI